MLQKSLSGILTAIILIGAVSPAMPVMASEAETQTEEYIVNDKTLPYTNVSSVNDVQYEVDIPTTFSLTIPKLITLDGSKGSYEKDYSIDMVSCDIRPADYVVVTADKEISLKEKTSGSAITATNSMTQEVFTGQKTDDTRNGNVKAENLTAGSWSGTITWNVSLTDTPPATNNIVNARYTVYYDEAETARDTIEEQNLYTFSDAENKQIEAGDAQFIELNNTDITMSDIKNGFYLNVSDIEGIKEGSIIFAGFIDEDIYDGLLVLGHPMTVNSDLKIFVQADTFAEF